MSKSREGFRRAFAPKREAIDVDGQTVYISELSGEQALSLKTGGDYIYQLLLYALVDADGKRLFGDAPEDLAELKAYGSRALRKLIRAAVRINGLEDDPEKNSGAAPSGG